MSDDNKGATLSLKVTINKERSKVFFADSDSHFADILLSFLTLPLGRIVKVLEKHYGDEPPTIGSLSSLYRSLVNLDSAYFWTDGAKQTLLNPTSSSEAEYERLKLDITDFQPAEYFYCSRYPYGKYHTQSYRFRSVSVYYDHVKNCKICLCDSMTKEVAKKGSEAAASRDGVFTMNTSSFIISDDLHIFPSETGLLGIISFLGITDMDNAEQIKVDLGFSEIMNLLKASLTSPTPLSDIILNKTTQIYSTLMVSQPHTAKEENPNNSRNFSLKVMIQQSTGKVLYAQANEQFVEFLFSFLCIPLGGVEHLLAGNTCAKAIDNLYRNTSDLTDSNHFITPDTKMRLMKPKLPHGYISKDYIFPLTEECVPAEYSDNLLLFSSVKFPNGQGSYLKGSPTYHVADDLTVTPFCIASTLSSLREQKISISDVKEVEMQIGLQEACSILKASLTSTTALTDALLTHKSLKQPKREV